MITVNLIALNARINWWAVQVSNLRPLQCECWGTPKPQRATEGKSLAGMLWKRLNAWKLHQIYTYNGPAFMRGWVGMFQSLRS